MNSSECGIPIEKQPVNVDLADEDQPRFGGGDRVYCSEGCQAIKQGWAWNV